MDNQQQQRINEAAEQFTDALAAAYKAGSDRTVAAQDVGAQLTGHFFNSVINNLRTQAEGTRQVTQQLAEQQRRAQEATRQYAQVSTGTYMDFLDSIFSFYQGGTSRAKKRIEEAERRAEEAENRAEEAERNFEEAERRAADAERNTEKAQRQTEKAEETKRRAEKAERQVEQAQRRAEEAERTSSEAESQGDDDLPLPDYDSLNIRQISERLDELSVEEIRRLRDYEARNKKRSTLVNRLDSRIESSSSQ